MARLFLSVWLVLLSSLYVGGSLYASVDSHAAPTLISTELCSDTYTLSEADEPVILVTPSVFVQPIAHTTHYFSYVTLFITLRVSYALPIRAPPVFIV